MPSITRGAIRPATVHDAPAIRALINEIEVIESGAADTETGEVLVDLTRPGTDPAHDSWLAFDGDGGLVAYAVVWDEYGTGRIGTDHFVLPGHQAEGEVLLDLMTARALGRAAANGAHEAVVHLNLAAEPTFDTALLRPRGWRTIRRYNVMKRAVRERADPVPQPLPGVRVRTCVTEDDRRRAHAVLQESFAEHFDHHDQDYERWLATLGGERLDWSLVWIAAVDGAGEGTGDLGVLLARDDRGSMGWVSSVGVRRAGRGRGIGAHLLRTAFAEFARRGRDAVGLGVDTQNVTGALRLYESLGMSLHYAVDTWELRCPAAAP